MMRVYFGSGVQMGNAAKAGKVPNMAPLFRKQKLTT
jgi:hypothetical protein